MSYNIELTSRFAKEAKQLIKKYPSLKQELEALNIKLKQNPIEGHALGNDCYKIRLAIASKGKGKSGGARIITYIKFINSKVFLLTIYDKAEQSDITDSDLMQLLNFIE